MKPDLSKLNGKQLFDFYTSQNNDYKSILFQAHIEIGDGLFEMLEDAEKQGKKIAIKENRSNVDDPPITVFIM